MVAVCFHLYLDSLCRHTYANNITVKLIHLLVCSHNRKRIDRRENITWTNIEVESKKCAREKNLPNQNTNRQKNVRMHAWHSTRKSGNSYQITIPLLLTPISKNFISLQFLHKQIIITTMIITMTKTTATQT